VADYEATTFSIFYNNALFLLLLIVLSFFILSTTGHNLNYLLSVVGSAGLVTLFSTGTK
jgi:translocon-associated protein subunit gamma